MTSQLLSTHLGLSSLHMHLHVVSDLLLTPHSSTFIAGLLNIILCRFINLFKISNIIKTRARILMTCHLSFLASQTMQFNILILDIERWLQKQLFYTAFFSSFCVVFKFQVIFVILASFSCYIFKVYFISYLNIYIYFFCAYVSRQTPPKRFHRF